MSRAVSIPRPTFLALAALVCLPFRANAQEPTRTCLAGRVRVLEALPADFELALDEACTRLEGASDVDPEVVLTVHLEGARAVVVASLPDGRSALRHVSAADRLLETMEALSVLPVHAEPAPSQLVRAPEPGAESVSEPAAVVVVAPPSSTRFELGGSFGGRYLASPSYAGVTVTGYAALRVRAWSLGLTVRWDPLVRVLADDATRLETSSLGVGFAFTRRWEPSAQLAFDFGATAAVDMQIQEYQLGARETSRTGTNARVGLIARTLHGHGRCRFLSALEVDVSPSLALHPIHVEPGVPRLPYFSVGLSAGVAWSPG